MSETKKRMQISVGYMSCNNILSAIPGRPLFHINAFQDMPSLFAAILMCQAPKSKGCASRALLRSMEAELSAVFWNIY